MSDKSNRIYERYVLFSRVFFFIALFLAFFSLYKVALMDQPPLWWYCSAIVCLLSGFLAILLFLLANGIRDHDHRTETTPS